ncbi:hypothetical protein THRCLA_05747 [Thraustotheca clavata]|uniref:Uncharacterized protein n=1 Tax=Thraustotheca clavata TaxID=74557 RepID=A0A1V9ZUY7_9STRA|nr:hypothetical protein THRCLA_05747 [Thraustotheca clavata]
MGNNNSNEQLNPENFNAKTTAAQASDAFADQFRNKVVVITGSNTGLGLETARVIASKGGIVVIACRTPSKGESAVASILKEFPEANVTFLPLDLASLASVRAFVPKFEAKFDRLNILINNAGVMACPKTMTSDGLESQFGVNHIGHFYLTKLLLPVLLKSASASNPSRVVNLSSMAQYLYAPNEGIIFDDLNAEKSYKTWERYGQGKLANVLFTKELHRRFADKHIISAALHPGVITSTELTRHMGLASSFQGFTQMRWGTMFTAMGDGMKGIPEGAATTVTVAGNPNVVPGAYYVNCQVSDKLHPTATDSELAQKLWDVSEKIVDDIVSK